MDMSIINARKFLKEADEVEERDQFEAFIDNAESGTTYYKSALDEFMTRAEDGQNPFEAMGIHTLMDILEECEENACE